MMHAAIKPFLALTISLLLGSPALAQTKTQGYELPAKGQTVQMEQIQAITRHFELHALWKKIEKDPPMNDFSSDGCSGWVEKWDGISLYQACFLHDLKYWAGYPNEKVARLRADSELMVDVAEALGSTKMAETMFAGVRAGGSERLKLPFSWGFGRGKR